MALGSSWGTWWLSFLMCPILGESVLPGGPEAVLLVLLGIGWLGLGTALSPRNMSFDLATSVLLLKNTVKLGEKL